MGEPRGPVRWLHLLGLGRPGPDDDVRLEIDHHLSECVDRLLQEGWEPEEARLEAERRFGDVETYRSPMRRMERRTMAKRRLASSWDLARATASSLARSLRRSPGFAAAIVATLALGIGANATMYGIVDRLLLQPPAHIAEPDRVARVFVETLSPITGEDYVGSTFTYPDYSDLRGSDQFAVAGYTVAFERTIGGGPDASRASVATATAELFPVLGVSPLLGRFYTAEEAAPGSMPTAVLGAEYWQSAYEGDPDVLGRTIEVAGHGHTIVGVAPSGFTGVGLSRVDVWLPLELTSAVEDGARCLESRGCHWMRIVGRLLGEATTEAVEAEATALNLGARAEAGVARPDEARSRRIVLASLIAARGPDATEESRVARWLSAVSLIVLLIACANVANLLLARGTRRRQEVAVRLALGASGRRIAAQVVAESICLALLGGVVALALAHWGGEIVRSTLLTDVYFPGSPVGGRLVLFTFIAAIAAGAFSGVAPAVQGTRPAVGRGLGDGSRASPARSRLRAGLTVFQAAMSVVLLVGAGLFVTSLDRVRGLDLGFDTDRVILARLEIGEAGSPTSLYEEAVRRVEALPGVESAAATSIYFRMAYAEFLQVPDVDSIPRLSGGGPYQYPVGAHYFETVGLALLRGRGIDQRDVDGEADVAVVSETMARTLWPDADPVGRCLVMERDGACVSVVGVAEDAARLGFDDDPFMAFYVPPHLAPDEPLRGLYVRSASTADDVLDEVSAVLRGLSPDVRYATVTPFQTLLDPEARSWTLGATMFTVFGVLALVLAAIGLYGVLAFDVAQRTRELGVRTALGARRHRLLAAVLRRGVGLGALGVALGLTVAYFAAPSVQDLLFEVSPRDPLVLGAVAVALLTVCAAASLIPGVRATRVDPLTALKTD